MLCINLEPIGGVLREARGILGGDGVLYENI